VFPPASIGYPNEHDDDDDDERDRITHVSVPVEIDTSRNRCLLLRLDGVHGGQFLSLGTADFSIGRELNNTLRLEEGGISRHHAKILWKNGGHQVQDLASRNGTYLRGRRVHQTATMTDGDLVQFGPRACFRYTLTDALHEQLLKQLYESSTLDLLTGICNRRHFEARLQIELSFAQRHNTDLALVMIDIDHFKKVNDTHGHPVGDAVIRHVVKLAQGQLRSEDLLARYGGEEFVALLRATDVRGAVRVAERIRATLNVLPARVDGIVLPVTISAGCAALLEPGSAGVSGLIRQADERLYDAKNLGRNRVAGPPLG
jgi:diguanylate cyclase (GGDEF)-like protein